jgi:glycerate 2-kinase
MKRDLRLDANLILTAALAAADPTLAVEQALRQRDFSVYNRIFVAGAGKASGTMASVAEHHLGARIAAGCVNVKDGDTARTERIELHPSGHPIPDERGLSGTRRIAEICAAAEEGDLVLCLLSGGASALMPSPAPPVTLHEKQETTRLLLACGAEIQEINAVRKHLSAIKGGQLARMAAPAQVWSLILSDVIGDDPGVIGSGPTAPDESTFATALSVLEKYDLLHSVPAQVVERLRAGTPETPKAGDPIFNRVENLIVGSNQKSLEAAASAATDLGYRAMILSSTMQGETKDVARVHAAIARQIRQYQQPLRPPACVISGGETTVMIRGKGRGGRNQEFALAAAIDLAGLDDVLILSAGTDGTDGPTEAAGAMADGATTARSRRDAAQALAVNDSYPYFAELGDLIVTGATGTNVMDLHLILCG